MLLLTVGYVILGILSVWVGLIGFMCFDAGVTAAAITMFILGWLPFLGFWLAIPIAWWGYRIHSRRLTLTGFALPFGAIFLICAYVVISLYA